MMTQHVGTTSYSVLGAGRPLRAGSCDRLKEAGQYSSRQCARVHLRGRSLDTDTHRMRNRAVEDRRSSGADYRSSHADRRSSRASPRWSCIAALLCALLAELFSCPALPAQGPSHFGHQSWSTEDGLPQNSVHQVLQARDGYLWIATEGGLARFDGLSFTIFRQEDEPAIPSNDIACLAEDSAGDLWIGTTDGLVRRHDGRFDRVPLEGSGEGTSVLALAAADDGSILALTATGVQRLRDHRASILERTGTEVQAIAEAPDRSVWLATATGLERYSQGRVEDRGALGLSSLPLGLQVERGGQVWLRTGSGLAVQPSAPSQRWTATFGTAQSEAAQSETAGRELPGETLAAALHDTAGRLWIGTRHGLYVAEASGAPLRQVAEIGSRAVLTLFEDRETNIWVGTAADGLQILRPQKFEQRPALDERVITALAETTDGSVWIGTRDDGLRVERSQAAGQVQAASQVIEPKLQGSLASQVILALAPGMHGDLWVGTLDGLDHVQGSRVDRFSSADGLPDDVVRSLLVDAKGALWIGTRRGLVHWSGVSTQPMTRVEGLAGDLVGAMLETHGSQAAHRGSSTVWVATLGGLSRFGDKDQATYTAKDGLDPSVITSLAEDDAGTLWIGTQRDGLSSLDNFGVHRFPKSGLPTNINSLINDHRGSLWIGTPRGIVRVRFADLRSCMAEMACMVPVAHFGFSDGMPTEETTASGHPAAMIARDSRIWFATTKGVAIVDPAHLRQNAVAPPVVIERFLVDTRDHLRDAAPLRLPFGHGSMSFDYAGLSFTAPSRVRYRYRLEGFDRQWTEAGSRRTAFYTNLPPGRYLFQVQAANNDGVWNRAGAELAFTILPPFYRRAPFYLVAVLLLAGLVYAVYYLRVRRLRAQFDAVLAERNRIAREIHDTLAQNFVGISIQLQVAEQLLGLKDIAGTRDQLQQTRSLVQEGLNDARQSIWELRASVAQDSLPTRLSRAVERASRGGVAAVVTIGGIYRPIAPELEQETLRIAGEALANVARHAHATEVTVTLQYATDGLQLAVVDNGRGFDPEAVQAADDHFGLQGMRERAAMLGATLSVVSTPGAGTSITLAVPLPRAERRSS